MNFFFGLIVAAMIVFLGYMFHYDSLKIEGCEAQGGVIVHQHGMNCWKGTGYINAFAK